MPETVSDRAIDRRRRNVRVLELLEASRRAHAIGNKAEAHGLMNEATDLDVELVAVITGAMRIGEIPQPGEDGWVNYLDAQRAHLAEAEAVGGAR